MLLALFLFSSKCSFIRLRSKDYDRNGIKVETALGLVVGMCEGGNTIWAKMQKHRDANASRIDTDREIKNAAILCRMCIVIVIFFYFFFLLLHALSLF